MQTLAPPKVPVAEQNDNVLDPKEQNVIAQVPPYYFMADGNDVTLIWMGRTANGASVIHEQTINLNRDDVGGNVNFLIPDDKVAPLAGGSVELYYTVTTYARALFTSPSLKLLVDSDGNSLPKPSVDGVIDGVLDPETIALEALARIQPYAGIASGDKVTLKWESTVSGGDYSTSTTINSGTAGKEVQFRIKKDVVLISTGNTVEVWYEVQRANRTTLSDKLSLKIGQSVVTPLPDPTVKEAKPDNTLDPVDTAQGATVLIEASANLKEGDVVTAFWKGPSASDSKEKLITAAQAGKALEVIFASALVIANIGKKVIISYGVQRTTGADQSSAPLELLITSPLSNLEKPQVGGVVNDVLAPESVAESGVEVTVPRYSGMIGADSIVVKWAGGASHGTPPQTVVTPGPLAFTVPKSVALASAGTAVAVTYEVSRGAALPVVSLATQFSVSVLKPTLAIDTSELVLKARIFRFGPTPSNPPAGAFANDRVASGGQPPYTYSVDNPVVNIDATSGRVISLKSGSARVTVTDSAGDSVSYPVKVSGVLMLFSLGLGSTFGHCNQVAASKGGVIPSLAMWAELRATYGNKAFMGNHQCWSTDSPGMAKRWAITPNTGATQALKDVGFGGANAVGFAYKAN